MVAGDDTQVLEVLAAKDYFEVLAIPSTCRDDNEVRKAYMKRSRRCHPDKCQHPRATEAFQRIAEAFSGLKTHRDRLSYRAEQSMNGGMWSGDSEEAMDARAAARATKEAFVAASVTVAEALAMFRQFVKQDEKIDDREVTPVDMLAKSIKMADVWFNGMDVVASAAGVGVGQNPTRGGIDGASGASETATERRKVTWRSVRLLHTVTQSVTPFLNDLLASVQPGEEAKAGGRQQGSSRTR